MERDRMGRRRRPEQERGLRPLHPPLPEEWTSKALRVTMSEADWSRFEALARSLVRGGAHPGAGLWPRAFRPDARREPYPSRNPVRSTGWTGSGARPYACSCPAGDRRRCLVDAARLTSPVPPWLDAASGLDALGPDRAGCLVTFPGDSHWQP